MRKYNYTFWFLLLFSALIPLFSFGVCEVSPRKGRVQKISFPQGKEISVVSYYTRQGPITAGGSVEESIDDIYKRKNDWKSQPNWETETNEFYQAMRKQKAIDSDQPYYPIKVYTDKLSKSRDHNKDLLDFYRADLARIEKENGFIAVDLEMDPKTLDEKLRQLAFLTNPRFAKIGLEESFAIVEKKKESIKSSKDEPIGGRERHLNFQQEKIDAIAGFKNNLNLGDQERLKDDSFLFLTSPVGYSLQKKKVKSDKVHFLGSVFADKDFDYNRSDAEMTSAAQDKREKIINSLVELPGSGVFFKMANSFNAVEALVKKCKQLLQSRSQKPKNTRSR